MYFAFTWEGTYSKYQLFDSLFISSHIIDTNCSSIQQLAKIAGGLQGNHYGMVGGHAIYTPAYTSAFTSTV